jgi:fumarylpyruvate hydrolase
MDIPQLVPPSLAIQGTEARFPVRRILCVGQNYAGHAREMGSDPTRTPPFFFDKPGDAVVASGATIPYPPATAQLDHEVELVVALGAGGAVWGHAVGLDLTRRDLQRDYKRDAKPWDMAKAFDHCAPIGPLVPGRPPATGAIRCLVDGKVRQDGRLEDMTWNVDEILAELGRYLTLSAGDLVFTGTPEGVGPIRAGETVVGSIDGLPDVRVSIAG